MLIKRVLSKIDNINEQLKASYLVVKHYRWLKRLSYKSLLSNHKLLEHSCQICASRNISLLVKIPLGIPGLQNHSLLYFNKDTIEQEELMGEKRTMDITLGFFLSVPWYFCSHCKNATMGIVLDQTHLLNYYSKFYRRKNIADKKRKATKELHGRYLDLLLNEKKIILEVGAADGFAAEYLANQGHNVYVYEPSGFQSILREKKIIKCINNLENIRNIKFDVIFMHHVLEHIYNPVKYLKKISSLLKLGGIIVIQVPDFSLQNDVLKSEIKRYIHSLFNKPEINRPTYNFQSKKAYKWFDALANDHVSAFSSEGLKYVLAVSGFHLKIMIQTTTDNITHDNTVYSWPVDKTTGNTPNSLTAIAEFV